jgi:hypothetical protein
VSVTVRAEPLPPVTMPAGGTSVVFEETAVSVSAFAAVSASPIVTLSGPAVVPAGTVWFGVSEIVGASLTAAMLIATVAGEDVSDPSRAVNVKASGPL